MVGECRISLLPVSGSTCSGSVRHEIEVLNDKLDPDVSKPKNLEKRGCDRILFAGISFLSAPYIAFLQR